MLLRWPTDMPDLQDGLVTLRAWRNADCDAVFAACQDPAIQRWARVPAPYLLDHAVNFVGEFAREEWMGRRGAPFCIASTDTDDVLGSCSLMDADERDQVAEVGYWVAPWARQQGVATQALGLLTRWALTELGMARLEVFIEQENRASTVVAQRCGYATEGVLREKALVGNQRRDVALYAILRTQLRADAL